MYDLEKFIAESRSSIQPFLKEIMLEHGVSYFDGFVTERLRPTSKRKMYDGEFENEIAAIEKRGFGLVVSFFINLFVFQTFALCQLRKKSSGATHNGSIL